MTWIEDQVNLFSDDSTFFNESNPLDIALPTSQESPLELLDFKHYYGMWVVIQPEQESQPLEDTFFCRTPGTYYYVDALTGEVLDTRIHR